MTVYDNPVFFRRGCAIVNSEKWSETETTEREILQEMKYQNIIENMTLKEKAAFLSGKSEWQTREFPRLDIPAIFCSDGPNGVRKQAGAGDHLGINPSVPATCFPTAATMANSWDEELEQKVGVALGEESMEEEVNVLLGPGLNIKRNPLCGRNFEYFSEDPYLSGKMAAAFIRGVQSTGAAACAKHFAVNSQELRRMAMNAVVDFVRFTLQALKLPLKRAMPKP